MKRSLILEENAEQFDDTILPSGFVSPYKNLLYNHNESLRRVIIIATDKQLTQLDAKEASYLQYMLKNKRGTETYNPETGLTIYRTYDFVSILPPKLSFTREELRTMRRENPEEYIDRQEEIMRAYREGRIR